MADRIITASRTNARKKDKQQAVEFKTRYFNLMEPTIAGYLTYCTAINAPFEVPLIRRLTTSFAPYFKVSERLIELLNENKLTNFSHYFLELAPKSYSTDIHLQTFCTEVGLRQLLKSLWPKNSFREKDFWKESLYRQHKNTLALLYRTIETGSNPEESKAQREACLLKLQKKLALSNDQIIRIQNECSATIESKSKIVISANFGEKTLVQNYRDEANGEIVNMAIESFQVDSVGQWIGLFSNFVEAKATSKMQEEAKDEFFEEPEGQFTDLIAYYRFDEGKGDVVQDLSDYGNNATIANFSEDVWCALEEEPLEVEDKWGKKCPPQFSIRVNKAHWIERTKQVNYRPFSKFTVEIWVKLASPNGVICSFGENTSLQISNGRAVVILEGKELQLNPIKDEALQSEQSIPTLRVGSWEHLCLLYQREIGKANLIINCMHGFEANYTGEFVVPFGRPLRLGSESFDGELTEFRLWKNKLSLNEIKDCFRSPLSIVSQKRKKLKMKLKQKKSSSTDNKEFASIAFDPASIKQHSPGKATSIAFEMPPGLDWGIPM